MRQVGVKRGRTGWVEGGLSGIEAKGRDANSDSGRCPGTYTDTDVAINISIANDLTINLIWLLF